MTTLHTGEVGRFDDATSVTGGVDRLLLVQDEQLKQVDPALITQSGTINPTDGRIPMRSGGLFADSPLRIEGDRIISDLTIEVPNSSIGFTESVTMSEANSFMRITNQQFPNVAFDLVDARNRRTAPSNLPRYFRLSEAQNQFILQPVNTEVITTNPLIVTYTATLNAQTNVINFQANGAMTNVRVLIRYNTGPRSVIKYFPSKSAWDTGTGGQDFSAGMNSVDLGISPLRTFVGDELQIEVRADNIDLLGDTNGFPYVDNMIQRGEFMDILPVDDQETATDSTWSSTRIQEVIDNIDPPVNLPEFGSFAVSIPNVVTDGTTISGTQTFTWTITNPSSVSGDLTIQQDGSSLSTTVDASIGAVDLAITSETLNTGDSVVFTISGMSAQGMTFNSTYTVRVPQPHEFLYSGLSSSNNPATVNISSLDSDEIRNSGQRIDIETGTTTAGQYLIVLAPTNEDVSTITDALGNNVTDLFTRTEDVRVINSVNYTSYVVGPLNAGGDEEYTVEIA